MSRLAAALLLFGWPGSSHGSLTLSSDPGHQLEAAGAVFRGTVLALRSYEDARDGGIYTESVFRSDEVFKGALPAVVRLVHRGGTLPFRGESDGFSPRFEVGEQWLLFVSRRPDGTLFATLGRASALRLSSGAPGPLSATAVDLSPASAWLSFLRLCAASGPLAGIDATDQEVNVAAPPVSEGAGSYGPPPPAYGPHSSATNLASGTDLIPARFLAPDRGEPIPYYVDADYLPAGVTLAQGLDAVRAALGAWTNVTSIRFQFAGVQSFGVAAPDIPATDGALRIQLHDHYGSLAGAGEVLGKGGRTWAIYNLSSGWTLGGNVAGNDFHRVEKGYVVIQDKDAFMSNLDNLKEVLCHEVGHAIGLEHSSEVYPEPNPLLSGAIMYFQAHGSGRGATLNNWDINVSRQVHPPSNTPPYSYPRAMEIVTTPSPQTFHVPGVNTVRVPAYDLQSGTLSVAISEAMNLNGVFSLSGDMVSYVPTAYFGEAIGDLDVAYARCSDGVNASPYVLIRVAAFRPDASSEGIPDSWRLAWFGSADPRPGSHAGDDPDGDGFSNLQEYLLGSSPTDKHSNLRITSFSPGTLEWQAKPDGLYEIQSSTNLVNWKLAVNPITASSATNSVGGLGSSRPREFFRVMKVP